MHGDETMMTFVEHFKSGFVMAFQECVPVQGIEDG